MILKNLLRRKGRTLLTVLGISIGVAAIIGLGAMANGLQAGYSSMMSGSRSDLIHSQANSYDVSLSSVDEEIGSQVAVMPEVAAISGMLQGIVETENSPYFFVFGYPEDSFVLKRFQIKEGVELFERAAHNQRGKPLILGKAASETLKKKVGDTLRLGSGAYRVVGIYETGDAFEDSGAVLPMDEAQKLLGKQRLASMFYVQLKDPAQKDRLIERVNRRWKDVELTDSDEFGSKQAMSESFGAYVWVIAGLAIVLGGVSMMNAQLMAVYERTREIGVLRAVGWTRWRVLLLILGESMVVCLAGGVLGVLIGWLVLAGITSNTLIMGASTASITVGLISQAFVTVVVLGLVGGLYPAWRAGNLQPIEALRYEGGSSGGRSKKRLPWGGMAAQSLWKRKTRTILTLSVIGLTVGSIMVLEAITNGMADQLTNMGFSADAEIIMRQANISDTGYSAIDERIGDKIAALPEVQAVSGMIFSALVLPDVGGFFIIMGYAPGEMAINKMNLIEGERLRSNRQVMLGRKMADALNKGVGDSINLGGSRFRICGVYTSSVGWEEMGGVLTLRDAQNLVGKPRKVSMYSVKLKDTQTAREVVDKINAMYPDDVSASLSGEFAEQMPDMQNMSAMLNGISFLAILVGGLGMMNTMLMAVLERTREIGVLRALGWRRRAVLRMIMDESLLLSALGGVGGIVIAFLLNGLISMAGMMGEMFQAQWNIGLFIRALMIAFLLGGLGGLYPAYRATRLQPVEAIRYE